MAAVVAVLVAPGTAQADTRVVNTPDDHVDAAGCNPADCSLREAFEQAADGDVIQLQAATTYTLKRELTIRGDAYTLTVTPLGFLLAHKGRRKGLEITWADLVSGEAALATALNASLTAPTAPHGGRAKSKSR